MADVKIIGRRGTCKVIDLTGQRFGRLVVLEQDFSPQKRRDAFWLCECDCGNKKIIQGRHLRSGESKSCGCRPRTRDCIELTGKRFGRLIVLERDSSPKKERGACWLCRCDCGEHTIVPSISLRKGSTQSCGCLRNQRVSETHNVHGMTGTTTYVVWQGMLSRCDNGIKNYGERGISVCERWRKFENFLADMGERPKGMSLDRIDNDGNYEPGNCRSADGPTQHRNKRTNVFITVDGQRKTLAEWAEVLGVPRKKLYRRRSWGWPDEHILFGGPRTKKDQ